ncbi:MAG: ArdC family protein [Desulfatibacillaceae bacterium]|nr:ArdC family protein [Desulfatibacillaceae bacterium]
MNDKVKSVIETILNQFETGDIPEAIALSMFPRANIPSAKWSLLNRTLMFLAGTADARGFRQWQEANRHVQKGAKAVFILVPFFRSIEEENGEKAHILTGFGCKAVFRLEDTSGEPLDYQQVELPDLPLMDRAAEWGISVKAIPGDFKYYGYYSHNNRQIALATAHEAIFFHELAHAAHDRLNGGIKGGQDPVQEIVAELSAQALCRLAGKTSDTMGNSYRYIKRYAEKLQLTPHSACLRVMAETEKVLNLILQHQNNRLTSPKDIQKAS